MKRLVLFFYFLSGFLSVHAMEERFINEPIFNASVYMQTAGNPKNPTVVLVHGLGDEASSIWQDTIAFLEDEYYVISFDLPGFGKSTKANKLYSPENYAKFTHYVTQTYVKKPFHLIGHSMGGAIALKYASMYPTDVESLILVDAAGILHKSAYTKFLVNSGVNRFFNEQNTLVQKLQTPKLTNFIDRVAEKVDRNMTPNMDTVLASETLRESVLGGNSHRIAAVALVQSSFNGIPQAIQTRTTLIWGEDDDVAPLQTGYVLQKLMPHASLKMIPNAQHVPITSHEKEFFSLVSEHLKPHENTSSKPTVYETEPYRLKISNVTDKTYTGTIEILEIRDSHNIVIKDANIGKLLIVSSDVEIINSTLTGKDEVALTTQNSNVAIIASDLFGTIKFYKSRLDLAGIVLTSAYAPLQPMSRSIVIFSLCTMNGKLIHGKEVLGN